MKKNLKTGFYRIYIVFSVVWLITFSFLSIKFSNSEGWGKVELNYLTFSIFYIGLFPVVFNGYKDLKKIYKVNIKESRAILILFPLTKL